LAKLCFALYFKNNQKNHFNFKFALQFFNCFKHFITFFRFKIKVAHHFGNGADEKVDGIHPVVNVADEKVNGIHLVGNGADEIVDVADEKVDGIHPVGNGADEKVDGIHLVENGVQMVGDFFNVFKFFETSLNY